jgi:hypothetical protein
MNYKPRFLDELIMAYNTASNDTDLVRRMLAQRYEGDIARMQLDVDRKYAQLYSGLHGHISLSQVIMNTANKVAVYVAIILLRYVEEDRRKEGLVK